MFEFPFFLNTRAEGEEAINNAASLHASAGQWSQATNCLSQLANFFDQSQNWGKAAETLMKTADYYESDHAPRFGILFFLLSNYQSTM